MSSTQSKLNHISHLAGLVPACINTAWGQDWFGPHLDAQGCEAGQVLQGVIGRQRRPVGRQVRSAGGQDQQLLELAEACAVPSVRFLLSSTTDMADIVAGFHLAFVEKQRYIAHHKQM